MSHVFHRFVKLGEMGAKTKLPQVEIIALLYAHFGSEILSARLARALEDRRVSGKVIFVSGVFFLL